MNDADARFSERYRALSELAARHGALDGSASDLTPYELKLFSQNGEDGVIAELLRRCGEGTRWFCEFGSGPGLEGNCVFLADVLGWSGFFAEADPEAYAGLERKYTGNPRVTTVQQRIGADNVEQAFAAASVPSEPGVLSIDVDGPDYWIWEALSSYRPRIVVIEYNATLPPGRRLVKPREVAAEPWDATNYFGASIEALRSLGESKGYRLAHTDLTGTNAFFVRDDLGADLPDPATVPLRAANYLLAG